MKEKQYDIFISYRRDGGYETAKHLYDLLTIDGFNVSFDLDTLRCGDFDTELLSRIDQCTDFILVLDVNAFDRTLDTSFPKGKDWLRCELSYALKKNKNIIPVFLAGMTGFPEGLPDDVAGVVRKNGPQYNQYYFDDFYRRLKESFILSKPGRNRTLHLMKKWGASIIIAMVVLLVILWGVSKLWHPSNTVDLNEMVEYLGNYDKLQVGDFLYEDGTFSHRLSSEKNAIGVVFSLSTTSQERRNGWTHGQVMAMNDCGQGAYYQWGKNVERLPYPHWGCSPSSVSMSKKDKQGYQYTYKGATNSSSYPAFFAARNHQPKLVNGSGWYVPTLGQWIDILKNLGGIDVNDENGLKFDEETAMSNLRQYNVSNDYYWTATEYYREDGYEAGTAWVIYLGQRDVGDDDDNVLKTKMCKVRAIAAI